MGGAGARGGACILLSHALLAPLTGLALLAFAGGVGADAPAATEKALAKIRSLRPMLLDVASAGARLVAVGERGTVLVSDDRGQSWRGAQTPTSATLTAVYFHDARHGWAVGHDAVILRTQDGGETWALVHSAPREEKPLLDVWFASADSGIAVGAYGLAYATQDGGRSWRPLKVLADDMHLNALARGSGGRLYIAGEAGTLARSTDGGRSWSRLPSPYRGSYFGMLALPDGTLLLHGLRGKIHRSTDDGRSWTPVESGTQANLLGGAVLDDGAVVLVGYDGVILVSRDQGRRFALSRDAEGKALAAAAAAGPETLLLFGEGGVTRHPLKRP
ncbi:MAG: hypothetical protein A2V92_00155 [Candidatus Muproteobacteria bacterium RBG_16_65_31]|uniref:Photosynthesis system II assembly factor Ycf48/Hcf136-like domain-containing protein n=1 Tax=Candidatus Muproteobacteria bacterium RBG_16_65_31 TaxID=1817759 RepID=A0A1F6TBF7_9PROT|nr:MAG: hypothetical protein A2V92_00155 [Candidatus Muproteobacteria bacterium RBG_16_65_31]